MTEKPEMRKGSLFFALAKRTLSSESGGAPTLYSFLQPAIFSPKKTTPTHPANPQNTPAAVAKPHLEAALRESLLANNTDEAWKSFKSLTAVTSFPSKPLTNSLISRLSSLSDTHSLKRAFAAIVFVLEKNPSFLEFETVKTLLGSMRSAGAVAPALALATSMLKNRFFMPFELWGCVLVDMCRKRGSFSGFLSVFDECCRLALDDKVGFMKPDLVACNAALEFYCCESESVVGADKVLEKMSLLGVRPDAASFGLLGYLYAVKGMNEKVVELEGLLGKLGVHDKSDYLHNVVRGYLKSCDFDSVTSTILRGLEGQWFSLETCSEVVKGFFQNGDYKTLANLIIESQKIEPSSVMADRSFGYGVITACVSLGFLDKAHSILDEMNAQGASIGLGPYVPILNAYCKQQRTSEAAQLVSEIGTLGLNPDASTYDALIESSMLSQDFQSAFSLFRDMRGSRADDLKTSYLTIITGLTEHHRPELMAAFLDEIVEDPRIEIGTHDWNSIIHAFCKAGRMEDARRTFRRMSFLNYEPNGQTYLSMINGYVALEKYFSVMMLWNEVRRKISIQGGERKLELDNSLVDAFLFALVKGGFFDAVMQVVEKSREMKIYLDKWRYKQAFMEKHRKLNVSRLRKRNIRKMESLVAFKNWAGLSG